MFEFEVRPSDYMFKKGRTLYLRIGIFGFYINTADQPQLAFNINIKKWFIGWGIEEDE